MLNPFPVLILSAVSSPAISFTCIVHYMQFPYLQFTLPALAIICSFHYLQFLPLGKEGYCNHNVVCLSVCEVFSLAL